MPFARDDLFDRPRAPVDFRFDERTAAVFADMIHRSIPGYATLLELLGVIGAQFVTEGGRVYDLGCSLGGAALSLRRFIPASAAIVALDLSPAMTERLRAQVQAAGVANLGVETGDARSFPLAPAQLVVMHFLLQFIAASERPALLERVYQALVPGGALLLAEKTRSDEPRMQRWYEAFKKAQGYSQLAIARKRESLEQVMRSDSAHVWIERLHATGFCRVTPYFQGMMFTAWVAEK